MLTEIWCNSGKEILLDLRTKAGADLSAQTFTMDVNPSGSATPVFQVSSSYVGTVVVTGQTRYRFAFDYTLAQGEMLTLNAEYDLHVEKSAYQFGVDIPVKAVRNTGT